MTTHLPYNAAARTGGPVAAPGPLPPAEELADAMSMIRTGLFFIAVLSIGILAMAIMNSMWGAGKQGQAIEGLQAEGNGGGGTSGNKKAAVSYPNKTRDYIILAGAMLMFIVTLPSIYRTYPKR